MLTVFRTVRGIVNPPNIMLNIAQRFIENNNSIPILTNVLCKDRQMIGTDLDTFCIVPTTLPDCCVNAKSLALLLDGVTDPQFDIIGDKLRIRKADSEALINTIDLDQFPSLPNLIFGSEIVIPFDDFKRMVDQTLFAATKEQSRFALVGIKIIADTETRFVATDGHRLSVATCDVTGSLEALVALKPLTEALKLKGDVSLSVSDNTQPYIRLRIGEVTIISRCLSGNFPSYEMVLPKDNHIRMTCDRDTLANLVAKQLKLADRQHRLRISITPDTLSVSVFNDDISRVKSMPCVSNDSIEFGINGKYLADALKAVKSVTLTAKDNNTQIELLDDNFRHVVMPFRT